MKKFINDDFLLNNKYSRDLYHGFVEKLPLIDFHCHLDVKEICEDARWDNIAQVWLGGDHYKWRLMRSNGADEKYCTGEAPDRDKFQKFAEAMPYMLGNPMYHWSHLELARFFGIDDKLLNGDTAGEIWDRANEVLRSGDFSARACMIKSGVEAVCTTDDPVSDLSWHKKLSEEAFPVKVLPSFRPDKAFAIDKYETYIKYLEELENASGIEIRCYDDLLCALKRRHDFFHSMGCRVSDYGMDTVWFKNAFYYEVEDTFKKAISSSELIAPDEVAAFKSALLLECAAMDSEKGWVRQMHIGALRNVNVPMYEKLGPDAGFDTMGESNCAESIASHLNSLAASCTLGKTVIYNNNPKDNDMLAAMIGAFQDSECAGKIQLGAPWWFLDSLSGMRRHYEALSSNGLFGRFVGMVTDSRSFLSYARHEYFRRALCSTIGSEMEAGRIPQDIELAGSLVRGVSYFNAKGYFNF